MRQQMKKYSLSLFILLTSCSPVRLVPHLTLAQGLPAIQCHLPAFIAFDSDFPDENIPLVIEGVKYWNEVTRQELFSILGKIDKVTEERIQERVSIFSLNEELSHKYAEVSGLVNADLVTRRVCIVNTRVTFFRDAFKQRERALTTVRHEAGHLLGLVDVSHPNTALMFEVYMEQDMKVKNALPEEIDTIKWLYRLR
jgi:hypothetical protein